MGRVNSGGIGGMAIMNWPARYVYRYRESGTHNVVSEALALGLICVLASTPRSSQRHKVAWIRSTELLQRSIRARTYLVLIYD